MGFLFPPHDAQSTCHSPQNPLLSEILASASVSFSPMKIQKIPWENQKIKIQEMARVQGAFRSICGSARKRDERDRGARRREVVQRNREGEKREREGNSKMAPRVCLTETRNGS